MESEVNEADQGVYVRVPLAVLRDRTVSPAAKLTYARLLLYAGRDGRCNPAQGTLAAEVCLGPRQIRTVLSELKARGWITWKRTGGSSSYEITGPLPDRKKTADQIGRNLPIRAEENFLQKDLRKEQRKEDRQKRTPDDASGKPPMRSQSPVSDELSYKLPPGWTDVELFNLQEQMAGFMDGERPPAGKVRGILNLAREHSLTANDIRDALQAAWRRRAAPGQRNAPRDWNWFYETVRTALVPGYEVRRCGP
jgi:hypothetical protein